MIYRLEFHVSQSRYSTNIFGRQAGRQTETNNFRPLLFIAVKSSGAPDPRASGAYDCEYSTVISSRDSDKIFLTSSFLVFFFSKQLIQQFSSQG